MAKGIIFNADDYGPSKSINEGIITGIKKGIVNSVSVFLTFGEDNYDSIIRLKEFIEREAPDNVRIGLHFTVTAGSPVNNDTYKTLTIEDGKFSLFDYFRWNVDLQEFENEMDAQLNKLAELLGGYEHIDHINCHQGICFMKSEFWEILTSKNLPVRTPVKFSAQHTWFDDIWPFSPITRIAIKRITTKLFAGTNLRQKKKYILDNTKDEVRNERFEFAKQKGIKIADSCLYSYYKQANVKTLHNVVEQLGLSTIENETVEIMLHLCSEEQPSDINDHWGIDPSSLLGRKKELDELIESNILQKMKDFNIEKINYSDLK